MFNKKIVAGVALFASLVVGCNVTPPEPEFDQNTTFVPPPSISTNYETQIPDLNEPSIQIHYQRLDNSYAEWCLWLWSGSAAGAIYEFNYADDFGVVASYPISTFGIDVETETLGFIVRMTDSWTKDFEEDRFIDFKALEKDEKDVYHVYIYQGDGNIYSSIDKSVSDAITSLGFIDKDTIVCQTNNEFNKYEIYENDVLIYEGTNDTNSFSFDLPSDHPFSFDNKYTAKVYFKESGKSLEKGASIQPLYASEEFNEEYYYDGELGALYSADKTTFRVWSPVSSKIVLKVYENGTPTSIDATLGSDVVYKEVEMTKKEKGVFEAVVEENLEGKYYTYAVYNGEHEGTEVCDPYAKSTGVNGIRGMIVNFEKTNPANWDDVNVINYDKKSLTVWETHVADVTSSETWTGTEANRKKFLGLIEEGTTYSKDGKTVKTGFDHIKELGVNAVQFVPIFDQENDETNPTFNWGYNPKNYNSLEGVYSSNPHDGYAKIKEFKQVVKAFNGAGINIIMDVVYNHTSGLVGSTFDVLVPGYYYRYSNGKASNGSGCGNETASENAMFRKYMIDSTKFWADEYKLGGFRFDLMALHDIETMNLLTKELQQINPTIAVYGEPWAGGTTPLSGVLQAKQDNGNKFVGYGQFNDKIRDELIKGGLSGDAEKGWVNNTSSASVDKTKLTQGIKGIVSNGSSNIGTPDNTVTYVTCHDNYTLYDRMVAAGITGDDTIKKMAVLANAVVFSSQGTSFMLAGEELLRTKGGDHNSYDSGYEVNELDYSRKIDFADVFANYQKLVAFKKNTNGLHLAKDQLAIMNIEMLDNNSVIKYTVYDTASNLEYIVIHANGYNVSNRTAINLTGYELYLDTLNKLDTTLGNVTPEAFQTIIASKAL